MEVLKVFAPDYYGDFRCIMGDCRHTCCAGWEIDIDEETAEYYRNIPGEFGKKLCKNIDFGEECSSFVLKEDERCPFLNEKGLCEIIINLGEKSLCQVCDDHPRFRNFYESRTEIGLGLCCEAAAKLVLEKETKTKIIEINDDGFSSEDDECENNFFALRERIFDLIQNREKSISERISDVFRIFCMDFPEPDYVKLAEIFLGLERLDEKWTEILEKIICEPAAPKISDEKAAEQLLCYYILRHFSVDYPEESLRFAVLAFYLTEKAAEQTGVFEAARLFSSEIEYSDENKEKLMEAISKNEV